MTSFLGWKNWSAKRKMSMAVLLAITALLVGIVPAHAASIADLLTSIITITFSTLANVLIGAFEIVVNMILGSLSVDLSTLKSWGFLEWFDKFGIVIRALGVGLASFALLWQLTSLLFAPYLGEQQTKSVGTIVLRALIFIPMTYFIQPVGYVAFEQMQQIYNAILDGYNQLGAFGTGGGWALIQITNVINPATFVEDMLASYNGNHLAQIISMISAPILAIISILLATIFIVIILWNFLKLLFELGQRFVIMLVMVYLSPLAAAAGVIGDGEIPRKGLATFISSGVLWLLNVWCVGIGISLINLCGVGMRHGVEGTFIWGIVTYGFLRIAQQLDDMFNLVGAPNTTLRAGLLDAMVATGGTALSLIRTGKSLASSGSKGAPGADKANPVKPTERKQSALSSYAAKAGDAFAKTKVGSAANAAVKTAAGGIESAMQKMSAAETAVNKALRDITGTPTPKSEIAKMQSTKRTEAVSSAFKMPAGAERSKQLSELGKNDPGMFKDKAVNAAIAKDVLNLTPGSELTSLGFSEKTGQMSGVIVTTGKDGHLSTSRAFDIEKANVSREGAGRRLQSEVTPSSQSTMDAKTGKSQQLSDFQPTTTMSGQSLTGANGQNFATMDFTDKKDNARELQIERAGTPEKDFAKFNVIADDGTEAVVTAPRMATAEDVGKVLSGTASPELASQFAEVESKYSDQANTVSTIQKRLGFNGEGESTVRPGTAFENSPNTGVEFGVTDKNGETATYSMNRVARAETPDGKDSWSITKDGQEVAQFQTVRDTGAVEAMSSIVHNEEYSGVRETLNIGENVNPTMSFKEAEQYTGPEKMAMEVPTSDSGLRENGVTINRWDEVQFGQNDKGDTTASMYIRVPTAEDPNMYTPAKVTVTDYGADKDAPELLSHFYDVEVTKDGETRKFNCVTNKGVSVDNVVASFMTGNFDAAEIPGFEKVEDMMGMENMFTQDGYSTIVRAARNAREGRGTVDLAHPRSPSKTIDKGRGRNEDNPVVPEKT